MPTSLHPQAKFDPLPPDLDLQNLVEQTPNFKWVQRVSRHQIRSLGQLEFEKLIKIHVVDGGKPLVIDGWEAMLPRWLFNAKWLEQTYDKKQENVRDITAGNDIPMTTGHYLRSMEQLTNQWTPQNFRDERRQRLYLKDIDCPPEWHEVLQKSLHPSLFYLNENVTMHASSVTAQKQHAVVHHNSGEQPDESALAPAGDLMSSLPEVMRAQNLMCYIGHEGTYTPAHREMCASLGHNIMVEASGDSQGEKPGHSIWFMTESKDRDVVREYFLSMLGHDIEIEKHFAQVNAWKKAPFDVYLVDQRPGDFIVIPPLAAHQVWNSGTRTMKVAWNRTTPETLRLALHEALPRARLVCRDEQYKNKAIIYFTLEKYFAALKELERREEATQSSFLALGGDIVRSSPRAKQLLRDFRSLFSLFAEILVDETFASKEKLVEMLPYDSCITCSYCRSNIFNRFLTCKHCLRTLANGDEDAYDVCMECYAMGRSCACVSGLQWCEQWDWSLLIEKYEMWREMVIVNDGSIDLHSSPPPFEVLRRNAGKKSLAQVCQEALIRRPWRDIFKQDYAKEPSDSDRGSSDGKSKKKTKRKQKKGSVRRCHVCCHKDYSYRVHQCSNEECAEGYCYGVLYRAFDTMPQTVLQDENWQCPRCLGICNCGHCRRAGNTNPYTPKNTSLGLDTRPIADDRSIEALVDFRVHNLSWLKAAGEEGRSKDSRRMQRLRQQAANAKAQPLVDRIEPEVDGPKVVEVYDKDTIHATPPEVPNIIHDEQIVQRTTQGTSELAMASETQSNADAIDERSDAAPEVSGPMPTTQDGESSYPDPHVCSNYGIGMGYYEQDDTPDKILFDPYNLPSTDTIKLDSLEVPDSVRKSIRARKRKAKRENEDPEFKLASHSHKKIRFSNNNHMIDNMDPALFESNFHMAPSSSRQEPQASHELSDEALHQATEAFPSIEHHDALNEPLLRHAKPMTSYVEDADVDMQAEDAEDEDDNDGDVSLTAPAHDSVNHTDEASRDGVPDDVNMHREQNAIVTTRSLYKTSTPKRGVRPRGRPARRQSQYRRLTESPGMAASSEELSTLSARKRSRGRPRKSFVSSGTRAEILGSDRQASDSKDTAYTFATDWMTDGRSSRGHVSRRSYLRVALPDATTTTAHSRHKGGATENGTETARRRRITNNEQLGGLPSSRRNESSRGESGAPLDQQFMSMAQRLALKGKRFKIRKEQETDRLSSSEDRSKHQDSSLLEQNKSTVSPTRRKDVAAARTYSGQRTVVRLTDQVPGENDYQSYSIISNSDDSDDSDDDDIPAAGARVLQASTPCVSQPRRGRGRPRGRGTGRGRGRPPRQTI
ncbi:hypothetical protein E4U43_007964 [Claviceps pusilla]|uniref:JmjC domain-containing protein n=1 Tax=Claviceps pusilla TaxID=123648 RepID=A0A9P7NJ21_9HYPO|nr:hypothetical protein E4U43_007964 [Claviceps pusilla]